MEREVDGQKLAEELNVSLEDLKNGIDHYIERN